MSQPIRTIDDFRATRQIMDLASFNAINGDADDWTADVRVRDVSVYDGSFWILNHTDGTHYLLLCWDEHESADLSRLEELLWEFAAECYDVTPDGTPLTFANLEPAQQQELRDALADYATEVFVTPKVDGCHAGIDAPEDWSVDLFLFGREDGDIRNSLDVAEGILTQQDAETLAASVALALYGDASRVTLND
jgi:hypothetical protein